MAADISERERWGKIKNEGKGKAAFHDQRSSVNQKMGFGPNRASGHKGGMGRQGSKRG